MVIFLIKGFFDNPEVENKIRAKQNGEENINLNTT